MRHLDLFSGIGGFALAAREVWGDAHELVGFCDNDAFCQNVLRKNFPNVPIYGDIRELTAERLAADAAGKREYPEQETDKRDETRKKCLEIGKKRCHGFNCNSRIDLLTGGFPCQPFSNAGKKRGDQDDRFLWPEMLRVIRETRPAWIIGENVAGIINMALDQVCSDLEREGYEVQPFVIPAAAVGAPHRRDRVWIVGRREYTDPASARSPEPRQAGKRKLQAKDGEGVHDRPQFEDRYDTYPARGGQRQEHSDDRRRESGTGAQGPFGIGSPFRPFERSEWCRDWREVALETCHDRMDDGIPERLARLPDGSEISASRLRRESLKAYGNAIVPQVAAEIMRAIRDFEAQEVVRQPSIRWRERRVYQYPCTRCSRPAESKKKRRARTTLCQKCRVAVRNEEIARNQMTLV